MSRQSFRSVLKLAITIIGLVTMTHTASAGLHKDGCTARDIQMLDLVARWRTIRRDPLQVSALRDLQVFARLDSVRLSRSAT
jgi:hypothetical protein